ncbi:MAG: methyltransferase domain-containing protein [Burkholderiales bacterium]|nr:methyltransferase domain-containing protein [Burkholderiales bacterium]
MKFVMARGPGNLVRLLRALPACVLAAAAVAAWSAQPGASYQPKAGQEGKDVIWMPTPTPLTGRMLDLARVSAKDYVIDLGSGDGRLVIAAAKRGARALGIEYNADLVELSRRAAAKEGVGDRARFEKADIFQSDYSKATVVTLFLLPDLNLRLRPALLKLAPGTRIVSNSFEMGEWKADQSVTVTEHCKVYCRGFLWIVPAEVAGRWILPEGELRLKQDYQMVSGSLVAADQETMVTGRVRGEEIVLTAADAVYTGRVGAETIEGTIRVGAHTVKWRAKRERP